LSILKSKALYAKDENQNKDEKIIKEEEVRLTTEQITQGVESALQGTVSSDLLEFEAALKKKHEEITK